ncbi:MAG: ABC-F family ATP-binding cassette domain-containing protein [Elusimicrobia bacterium]|nr:ABC-F family ATP-binding cassette domain-containing protein [Elusimicrobiota bacterium]
MPAASASGRAAAGLRSGSSPRSRGRKWPSLPISSNRRPGCSAACASECWPADVAIFLSCQDISKSYGVRPLFERLSFGLFEGERTGLIGPNGTGKSTLLKILAGLETVDGGTLSVRRGLKVGYLPQQDRFDEAPEARTVREEIVEALQGSGLQDYEVDLKAEEGLAAAGFKHPEQPVNSLSGGWRKRLAVLSQVVREPDLLLFDEPTNHLDLEGVLWLESFLTSVKFSFLVVTHDRRFLERVTNRVIELNKRYPEGHFSSAGNYSAFLENRETLFAAQASREDSVRNIVRGEIEWLRKGPKARTTKQKARIDRAGELMEDLSELKYRNAQTRAADIDFTASERQTRRLIDASRVVVSRGGRRLFGPLDLTLFPGDKLGLLGENGSGKSTLLKVLSGELSPDSGALKIAEKLQIVTFDQHRDQLDLDMTLKRALCGNGEHVHYQGRAVHVAGWASRFLFRAEQLEFPVRRLSGGEQARVLIARLMLKPADVLFLDEPTNDLDLQSLEVLEQNMLDFPGALILVTHDRYLLDRVSKRVLALDGKGEARFFADLSQWEDWRAEQGGDSPRVPRGETPAAAPKVPLTQKEYKELKNMETAIHSAEAETERARAALEDPAVASDAAELAKRHDALEAARLKVENLFKRWEELDARRS